MTHSSLFSSRGLLGALCAGVMLFAANHAAAQPTKKDTPLKTPTPTKPAPGGKTEQPGQPRNGDKTGEPTGPGAPQPGGKVGTPPEIEYKGPPPGGMVNFNVNDAELLDLVKTISQLTGRRFIIGGKVRTNVKATIISPKDVTVGEAYQAFLAVLEQNGLTVVPHGRYLKVIETTGASSEQTEVLGPAEPVPYTDQFVTRLYRLKHIDAGEASGVLDKFKSKAGDIAVWPATNLLIITDTAASIRRLLRIVEEIDSGGAGEQIYLQPIHYSSAPDLAAQLSEMLDSGSGGRSRILADERNNSLVIVATEPDYKRILELIKRIDTPNTGEGTIHVLPLQHARCDEISSTLGAILGSGGGTASPAPRQQPRQGQQRQGQQPAAPASPAGGSTGTVSGSGGIFEGEVKINCDLATNSLVTVSSLRDYAQLRNVIDELDRPRRQVFIEAVIMDVNVDHGTDLGIGFHGGAPVGESIIYGGSNVAQSLTGLPAHLEALAFGVRGPDLEGSGALSGGTGISIPAFGVVLHALATKGDSNLLATPHILCTDNVSATISIGQNIPLQTNVGGGLSQLAGLAGGQQGAGGLAGLAGLAGGFGLGFQAPRQDVGITLTILPQINDSNQVRMDIQEEFSTAGAPQGDLGAVPINKRNANTTVIVEDQQTIVIGGLTREEQVHGETKIPVLGDIPVLGVLFRQTNKQQRKVNLLLILTPHVIRDQNDLRRIFERKMQERQEFLDRYFVFEDSLPWEPQRDYTRTNGMLERIRQTQIKLAERERLRKELEPDATKGHDPVKPIQLPAMAGSGQGSTTKKPGGGTSTPQPSPTTRPRPRPGMTTPTPGNTERPQVPGSVRTPNRYRVE
jgi:general secretion pathway protein D